MPADRVQRLDIYFASGLRVSELRNTDSCFQTLGFTVLLSCSQLRHSYVAERTCRTIVSGLWA